jgi:hypothetical protein
MDGCLGEILASRRRNGWRGLGWKFLFTALQKIHKFKKLITIRKRGFVLFQGKAKALSSLSDILGRKDSPQCRDRGSQFGDCLVPIFRWAIRTC